jgi:hypothetical protein
MFMGPCIVIIFYCTNSNKMHMSQSLFYLTIALHVSGVTITHLQEHKTIVTTASGNRYTALLSAAIVEKLEQIIRHPSYSWPIYDIPVTVGQYTTFQLQLANIRHPSYSWPKCKIRKIEHTSKRLRVWKLTEL